jgi:hypothetical protein
MKAHIGKLNTTLHLEFSKGGEEVMVSDAGHYIPSSRVFVPA